MSELLLHACCGPCSTVAVPAWRERAVEPVVWFQNPNIQPAAELERRLESMRRYGRAAGLDLVVEPEVLLGEAWGRWAIEEERSATPEERCAACLGLRLRGAAAAAARLGIRRFATTLTVSPYQRHDLIARAGEEAAEEHGVTFAYLDLRDCVPCQLRRVPPLRPLSAAVLRLRRQQVGGVARARGAQEGRMTGGGRPRDSAADAASQAEASRAGAAAALRLEDLDYDLPEALIAQRPAEPRDSSRLLVCRRATGRLEDRVFAELPRLLRTGDVLVRNDTRVFPARTFFRRATGGRIEVLFLRPAAASRQSPAADEPEPATWEALLRGRPRPGEELTSETLGDAWPLTCISPCGDGRWLVRSDGERAVFGLLAEAGVTPLPPYIHEVLDDPERYQTVYAKAVGSAAAPTAGLHFTPELDAALAAAGVTVETVTLHVGLGTFQPLQEETLAEGRLHGESYQVDAAAWARVRAARAEGRRVVAVGTTSMRTLEHLALVYRDGPSAAGPDSVMVFRGETSLFISPGFEFRVVDALLTNFHLPRTSLLALVMAFCGVAATRLLYAHAVRERYRFYSFGDAMLAL